MKPPLLLTVLPSPRRALIRLAQAGACAAVLWAALNSAPLYRPALIADLPMRFAASASNAAAATATSYDALPGLATGLDSIKVIVQHNDTLERIFRRLQLSVSDLADIRALDGARAMLDQLRPGETIQFLRRGGALFGLERHLSLTQKLKVTRAGDGFRAQLQSIPVQMQPRVAHAVITSSLFAAGDAAGISDATVMQLARIFGWDIDFALHLQPGDAFTVEYQRISQHGNYVKDGDILAARFINQGHVYSAVRYVAPDGTARYYTPDGHSMEKAFLRAPLEFRRISSGFSLARMHPILNRIRAHKGVDYAAPTGTPVYAAGDGRITFRGRKGGYGNVVEIDHGHGIVTVYGHLSRFGAIQPGQHVRQGQTIAYVGMTGLATGPHLHYEYHVNGKYVDPQTVKLPQATPIDAALRADFQHQTAPLMTTLDAAAATPTVRTAAATPAAAAAAAVL